MVGCEEIVGIGVGSLVVGLCVGGNVGAEEVG
jgi:hypothetical protein